MFKKFIHYSPELEAAIIGACLLEPSAFSRIFTVVTPEIFYSDALRQVYTYLGEMFENNIPVNLLSANDFIQRVKKQTEIEGAKTAYFLTCLTNQVTSTSQLEYFAFVLKQMWIDREIITLTSSGIQGDDTRQEIYKLQQKLTELTSTNNAADWKDMSELMVGLYKHQDEMLTSQGMGIQTFFPTIDRLYGGFFGGQMIVIGARPSYGKSAFAGQLAINMAGNSTKVGFISLEMSNNEIASRFAAINTNITFNEIFRGLYADENQRQHFYNRVAETVNLPIYVSDKTDLNVPEIKAKAYKLQHRHGLDCLVIDYLQLVDGDGASNRNRENEVAKISRGFKILAKEMNIPIIVLCQLNREVDKRKGKDRFPQLSDLRESGAIEQDADVVMFLHSDYLSGVTEDEQGYSTEHKRQLVIRKWRNGPTNLIIDLDFDGPRMTMKEKSQLKYVGQAPAKLYKIEEEDKPF